ncbi:MAG: type II toxin-antitoxin system VapC family toxin [Vicinamibacterales bacterium]
MIFIDSNIPMYLVGVDQVLPVTFPDIRRARELLSTVRLPARDALHVAVMEAAGIEEIMTFDTGFDAVPTIRRMI